MTEAVGANDIVKPMKALPRLRRRSGGRAIVETHSPSAPAAHDAGQARPETQCGIAGIGGGGEVQTSIETQSSHDLAAITLLVQLQRSRVECIKRQQQCDRSMDAFLVRAMNYTTALAPAERKKLFARAAAIRTAIEQGKPADLSDIAHADALPAMIELSRQAREGWDRQRASFESAMERHAAQLPAATWAKSVRGFSIKGLATIIGEAGDLSGYATVSRLWKRLGLAVIDGCRQGAPGNGASADEWIQHGYKPARRAALWVIGDVLFRAQWRGAKSDDDTGEIISEAHPIGPYGEIYAKRRAHTALRIEATTALPKGHREKWNLARCHADARRVMTKALIADLWAAWRDAAGKGGSSNGRHRGH